MLKYSLLLANSAVGKRLRQFKLALLEGHIFLAKSRALIFLCGANHTPSTPSKRRELIKCAAETWSPDARVIYAEGIFRELSSLGAKSNVLDQETLISAIADRIIIILEGNSAFAELGAFAHKTLRDKLIVINDSQYENSESFINLGPLKAIKEEISEKNVLWYPMSPSGVVYGDGIGAVFADLMARLNLTSGRGAMISVYDCLPSKHSKTSLYFAPVVSQRFLANDS